jgi:hypothetical protein
MEKEKAMPSMNRHRMIVHSFTISNPEQVHHFQIRLPRNAKQVVAIDYDLFIHSIGKIRIGREATISVVGRLKLQSLEKANIFYEQWLKVLEWNIGLNANGIFPTKLYTLLNKVNPVQVAVSPQTTILNGFYEDTILKNAPQSFDYKVNVLVWLEMKENNNGVEFEFLKTEKQ